LIFFENIFWRENFRGISCPPMNCEKRGNPFSVKILKNRQNGIFIAAVFLRFGQ